MGLHAAKHRDQDIASGEDPGPVVLPAVRLDQDGQPVTEAPVGLREARSVDVPGEARGRVIIPDERRVEVEWQVSAGP